MPFGRHILFHKTHLTNNTWLKCVAALCSLGANMSGSDPQRAPETDSCSEAFSFNSLGNTTGSQQGQKNDSRLRQGSLKRESRKST